MAEFEFPVKQGELDQSQKTTFSFSFHSDGTRRKHLLKPIPGKKIRVKLRHGCLLPCPNLTFTSKMVRSKSEKGTRDFIAQECVDYSITGAR